jgi:WD40 repeat protein
MKAVIRKNRPSFYVVGGTMRHDSPSYVERKADQELLSALMRDEFCYVLTARQMGKSSLMLRTAANLRASGVGVVVLDLTAIGQNLTAEQWYSGLLVQMGDRINLEDDLLEYWETQTLIGPMQRWMKTIREVVLPRYPNRLVIFIDEIDAVRSLGFPTDEFFAGIRECYNLRNEDREIQRLTFCLLGVATPSDLIRDTRTTPFNVGTRIDLNDFTQAEALPLADGLQLGRERNPDILKRVLYWTGGHPYLTQRICQAVAEDEAIQEARHLDQLIEELFFSKRAQEYDDNLIFVRERLLRSGADLTALLGLYSAIRRQKRIPEDDSNSLVTILRLSGITRVENGLLQVRNRIYERVFNNAWVTSSLPDFEIRRQRQAYRRGVWRTTAVSSIILTIVAVLALIAILQRNRAVEQASINRRLLYLAQMKLANQELEKGNIGRVEEFLNATRPLPGEEDLRGFEWALFYSATRREMGRLKESDSIANIKFLPNANILAIGTAQHAMNQLEREYIIKLYDLQARAEISSFTVPAGKNFDIVAFSPDLQYVATDTRENTVVVRDIHSGRSIAVLEGHKNAIMTVAFAPDNQYLASADMNGVLKIWDMVTRKEMVTRKGSGHYISGLAFSPDGRLIAITDDTKAIQIVDADTGGDVALLSIKEGLLTKAFFSGDGRKLAATSKNGRLYFWDLPIEQKPTHTLSHTSEILSFSLSPDGKTLATGAIDRTVRLWDVTTWKEIRVIRGHGARVTSLDWSSDGKLLVTGDTDGVIKIWDAVVKAPPILPDGMIDSLRVTAFSSDNELIALGTTGGDVKLWNLSIGREISSLGEYADKILCAAFSKDARTVATGSMDHLVRVYDVNTGKLINMLSNYNSDVYGLDFSPDGKTIISGGAQGKLRLWEVSTGREIVALDSGNTSYRAVFSSDGKWIASADQDGTIRLWDMASLQIVKTFIGHTRTVRFIAFSPNCQLLATSSEDNTVRLWDVAAGIELNQLIQSDSIPRFAFTKDGKRLVTGGLDGTVKLWDVTDMQEVITLRDRGSDISSITFSGDGAMLAGSSSDGTVMIWQAANTSESIVITP